MSVEEQGAGFPHVHLSFLFRLHILRLEIRRLMRNVSLTLGILIAQLSVRNHFNIKYSSINVPRCPFEKFILIARKYAIFREIRHFRKQTLVYKNLYTGNARNERLRSLTHCKLLVQI